MKRNGKEERSIEPIKLTKKEKQELQEQFPEIDDRLKNKLEILVMLFAIGIIIALIYVAYLMITYKW